MRKHPRPTVVVLPGQWSSKSNFAQNALSLVEISTGKTLAHKETNTAAVSLGRLGGLKVSERHAEVLSEGRRREIASAVARKH